MCRMSACQRCGEGFMSHALRGPTPKWCQNCKAAVAAEQHRKRNRAKSDAGYLLSCNHCGREWTARCKTAKFCSTRCQYLASGSRVILSCQQCGNGFECTSKGMRSGRRFCSKDCMLNAIRRTTKPCLQCGVQFAPTIKKDPRKGKGLYCSKRCAGAARRAGKRDGRWKEAQELRACRAKIKPSQKMYAAIQLAMRKHMECITSLWVAMRSECRYCKGDSHGKVYCSDVCSSRWHHFSKKPSSCLQCGQSLVGLLYQSRSLCLSCRNERRRETKRRNRVGNIRRRCRKYSVPYDSSIKNKGVFCRDAYRCQICGAQCLLRFAWRGVVPLALSPTVDHIVPLSWRVLGHTWDNVQCACWACNVKKSNRRGGQRRLPFAANGGAK